MIEKRLTRDGFTLTELLVVAGIFVVIMAITSLLFFRGRDAVELSSQKIDTAGRSRRALDALTPLIGSAVKIGGSEALTVIDNTQNDLTDACHLDVTTRENYLDSSYTSTAAFDAFGPYYRFRVAYEPSDAAIRIYKLLLASGEIDPSVKPRLVARGVLGCGFERVTVGSVRVTILTQADRADKRRPGGITTSKLTAILVAPGSR
ncbi:MAG TPA: type II secretion system protein [Phycisphaerales bacterium]|nr:type II secretion system protein [Phycisphaerales bacterium]